MVFEILLNYLMGFIISDFKIVVIIIYIYNIVLVNLGFVTFFLGKFKMYYAILCIQFNNLLFKIY